MRTDEYDSDSDGATTEQERVIKPRQVTDLGVLSAEKLPKEGQKSVLASQLLATKYITAEIRRRPKSFCIGVFTVFLVVFFVSVLLNSILKAPIVFFKLSENSVGENDLVATAGFSVKTDVVVQNGLPLLNHTHFNHFLNNVGSVTGTTPRWLLIANLVNPSDSSLRAASIILGIDSRKEAAIGLGREWPYNELNGFECVVSETLLRQIGIDPEVAVGLNVAMEVNLLDVLNTVNIIDLTEEDRNSLTPESARRLVEEIYPDFGSAISGNISIDLESLLNLNLTTLNISQSVTINTTAIENLIQSIVDPFNITLNFSIPNSFQANLVVDLEETINGFIANQTLVLNIPLEDIVVPILPTLLNQLRITQTLVIAGTSSSPDGKYPVALGSVTVLEVKSLLDLIRDNADSFLSFSVNLTSTRNAVENVFNISLAGSTLLTGNAATLYEEFITGVSPIDPNGNIRDLINELDEEEFSIQSISQYENRFESYVKEIVSMKRDLVVFSNDVAKGIGPQYEASFAIPLAVALEQTRFARIFLDNIFGSVVALVCGLGVLLIYSLLLNDVEEKTYEYGMLRALGMKQRVLIQILMSKSFAFACLGICLGLLVCFLVNIPIADMIADFAAVPADYTIAGEALLTSILLGLIMPLVANVLPISRALSHTLRDSLDVYHHVVSDVTVRITKLANLGLDMWQTALALLLIVVGFVTFYLIPYAFTFRKFGLFLGILNGILLGMLIGLCIMSMYLQPYAERLVLWVIVRVGQQPRLHNIVQKNLSAHKARNMKTALMFTVCLAFIIFAGVMFALQSNTIEDNVKALFGADLQILAPTLDDALNEVEMTNYLNDQVARTQRGEPGAIVLGFTYITFRLRQMNTISYARMANLPFFPSVRNFVYGIQENYLDVTYNDYWIPTEFAANTDYPTTPDGKRDAVRVMYTDAGNARLSLETGTTIRVPTPFATGSAELPQDLLNITKGATSFDAVADSLSNDMENTDRREMKTAYTEYVDVIVSEALRDYASVDTDTPLDMLVRQYNPNTNQRNTVHYLCKARAMASKVPGFFFSSYRTTAFFSSTLIKEPAFARILADADKWGNSTSTNSAPKQRLLIRLKDDATPGQRDDLVNGLRLYYKSDATISLDTRSVVSSANDSISLLQLFFTIVGVIALSMCFFILWLSFTANVQENAWEFGVLRAIGLSSFQAVMVYVYEALALVLSSLIIGTTIGILIAISLTLQFNLFVEMPFRFEFPHLLFWSMTSMALVVAVAGSALPAYSFLEKSISTVLRRQ